MYLNEKGKIESTDEARVLPFLCRDITTIPSDLPPIVLRCNPIRLYLFANLRQL